MGWQIVHADQDNVWTQPGEWNVANDELQGEPESRVQSLGQAGQRAERVRGSVFCRSLCRPLLWYRPGATQEDAALHAEAV